ncbi:hypothetical protein TNCV_1131811 [Trichonephila clavipes]|nr:hypothetical protein TNCV_1131811 [Trichonephila clavipes]
MWVLNNSHTVPDHELLDKASLLMCEQVSSGTVYSVPTSYHLDWTLTSIPSFYGRYFRDCLPMSSHLFGAACGFNRMGRHLIMEDSSSREYSRFCEGEDQMFLNGKSHSLRPAGVAKFRIKTGHDYRTKHLYKSGLVDSPACPLCNAKAMCGDHLVSSSGLCDEAAANAAKTL